MKTEPVLRPATRGDTNGICELLRTTFPDNAKSRPEVLNWQYWDNPFGQPAALVWEDMGRIVGHYSVVPYPGRLRGRPTLLGIGIDAAIDPAYQGRQLFGPLAAALYERAAAQGMQAIMCYPNVNSVRGIQRQGWVEVGLLRTWLLPLSPAWLSRRTGVPATLLAPVLRLARLRATSGRRSDQARVVTSVPHDADLLWSQMAMDGEHGVVRDTAWLQWRYVDRPAPTPYRMYEVRRGGRLVGLAVTAQQQQGEELFTYLLEFLTVDAPAGRAVINAILMAGEPSAGLVLATLPGTALAARAAAAGLLPVPQRLQEKPLHFGVVGAPADVRRGWALSWGDLDHL